VLILAIATLVQVLDAAPGPFEMSLMVIVAIVGQRLVLSSLMA
jgi:hypothetical protein